MTELWGENSLLSSDSNLLTFRNKVYSLLKEDFELYTDSFICNKTPFRFVNGDGALEGYMAQQCLDSARKYISTLRGSVRLQVASEIDKKRDFFISDNFAEKLLDFYKTVLEEKKKEMEAPQATLFIIGKIEKEVEALQC